MSTGTTVSRRGRGMYRRGAILGFTVAEVFILTAFVMLFLVTLMIEMQRRTEGTRLESTPALDPRLAALPTATQAAIVRAIAEGRLDAALSLPLAPDTLHRVSDAARREVLDRLLSLRLDPQMLDQLASMAEGGALERAVALAAGADERVVLVDDPDLLSLVAALKSLPPATRADLAHWARGGSSGSSRRPREGATPGSLAAALGALSRLSEENRAALSDASWDARLAEILATISSVREGAVLAPVGALAEIARAAERLSARDQGAVAALATHGGLSGASAWAPVIEELHAGGDDASDLEHALRLLRRLGIHELKDAAAERSSIRSGVQAAVDAAGRILAEEVSIAVAPRVRAVGGAIDSRTGAITFPEAALFESGSAAVTPALDALLGDVCGPWITALCRVGPSIGEVRIEGHASSEWSGEPDPTRAFLLNMSLSQRRASAVLERCLALVGNTAAGRWARGRLVAVGHSSARPILEQGVENARRSRRVVFRAEIDRDRILAVLEGVLDTAPPLSDCAAVR